VCAGGVDAPVWERELRPCRVGERGQRRQCAGRGATRTAPFRGNRAQAAGRVCAEVRCGGHRALDAPVWEREHRLRLFGERGQRRQRAGRGVHAAPFRGNRAQAATTRLCGSTMRRAPSSGRASLGPRAATRPVGERGQRRQRAGRGVHGRHLSGAIERRRPGRVCAEVRCGGRRGLDAPVWDREQRLAYSVSVGSDGSVLVAGHTDGTFPGQSSAGG
jgi:hypothetical protein